MLERKFAMGKAMTSFLNFGIMATTVLRPGWMISVTLTRNNSRQETQLVEECSTLADSRNVWRALNDIRLNPLDLIILDLFMHQINGKEFLCRLHTDSGEHISFISTDNRPAARIRLPCWDPVPGLSRSP